MQATSGQEAPGQPAELPEAVTDFGIGAELAALAAWEGFWMLDAPVRRVAPPPTPSPYAPNLEKQWLPDRRAIERAIEQLASL